jgi:hypothetical protein
MLKKLYDELKICSDEEPIRKHLILSKIKQLEMHNNIQKTTQEKIKQNIRSLQFNRQPTLSALDKLLELNKDDNLEEDNELFHKELIEKDNINKMNNIDNMDEQGYFANPQEIHDQRLEKHVEKDYINNKLKDRLFTESSYKGIRLKECEKPYSNDKILFSNR